MRIWEDALEFNNARKLYNNQKLYLSKSNKFKVNFFKKSDLEHGWWVFCIDLTIGQSGKGASYLPFVEGKLEVEINQTHVAGTNLSLVSFGESVLITECVDYNNNEWTAAHLPYVHGVNVNPLVPGV